MKPQEAKSKLTLWVGGKAKRVGKAWAKKHHESLSEIVANYLLRLETGEASASAHVTPLVKSLTGVIAPKKDRRKTYRQYLSKKYLGT